MVDYTFAITGQDLSGPAWKAFVDNVKKANEQVDSLGKTQAMGKLAAGIDSIKGRIDGLVSGAKALAGLWAVGQIRDYADGLQVAAAKIAGLAAQTGLTTEQVQALQRAARLGGEEFDTLAAYARSNSEWLDKVTESARKANTVIGGGTVEALDAAAKASEKAKREAGDLTDNFNALVAPSITWGLQQVSMGFKSIGESLDIIRVNGGAALPTIREIANILTGGQASRIFGDTANSRVEADLGNLERKVVEARQFRDRNVSLHGAQSFPARQAEQEVKAAEDALAAAQRADMQRRQREQQIQQEKDQKLFNPTIIPTLGLAPFTGIGSGAMDFTPKGGAGAAGGGGSARDRIGENLIQFTAQADAAKTALEALQKVGQNPLIPLDDLERQVKLEKDIADAIAAASKYAKNDPRIPQLEQQIRLRETAESGYRKFIDALKLADATERQYGDGQAARAQQENQLADARDTGRLSVQAYNLAIQELGKSTEDLRLKNLGLQGGLVGFMAGWEDAQNRFERANNAFAQGGRAFELVMNGMDQGLAQFVKNGKIELADFLGNFLLTIAQMEMRLAVSSLWNAAGGASGLGGIFSSLFGGGSSSIPTIGGGVMNMGGGFNGIGGGVMNMSVLSAGGGPLGAGQRSIVGENGPELFVPNTGGNVLNRQQLDALGVGGGGGDSIVINMGGLTFGEFVSPSQMRAAIRETYRAAVEDAERRFVDKRRRGVPGVKGAFN